MAKCVVAVCLALAAACSAPPESFDFGESDQAALACETWSAAAEYWRAQGESVAVECTSDRAVIVRVPGAQPTIAWLAETAAEGNALTGRACREEGTAGCACVAGDAYVSTDWASIYGPREAECALRWVATHELGHVLGYMHSDASEYPVMAAKPPSMPRCL
jgi:predicted Zn-dependent protease